MGSTVTGRGNVSPGVDFNFGCDPDSNSILMSSTQKHITLVPREVSLSSPMYLVIINALRNYYYFFQMIIINYFITQDWRKSVLGQVNSSAISFLNKAENIFKKSKKHYWTSADPRAVAIALWQNIVKGDYLKLNVIPIREGEARGAVLVDRNIAKNTSFNALTAMSIDVEEFEQKLIYYLGLE